MQKLKELDDEDHEDSDWTCPSSHLPDGGHHVQFLEHYHILANVIGLIKNHTHTNILHLTSINNMVQHRSYNPIDLGD